VRSGGSTFLHSAPPTCFHTDPTTEGRPAFDTDQKAGLVTVGSITFAARLRTYEVGATSASAGTVPLWTPNVSQRLTRLKIASLR
jgi:hypothetical protein